MTEAFSNSNSRWSESGCKWEVLCDHACLGSYILGTEIQWSIDREQDRWRQGLISVYASSVDIWGPPWMLKRDGTPYLQSRGWHSKQTATAAGSAVARRKCTMSRARPVVSLGDEVDAHVVQSWPWPKGQPDAVLNEKELREGWTHPDFGTLVLSTSFEESSITDRPSASQVDSCRDRRETGECLCYLIYCSIAECRGPRVTLDLDNKMYVCNSNTWR